MGAIPALFANGLRALRGAGGEDAPRVLQRKLAVTYHRLPLGLAVGLTVALTMAFMLPAPGGRRSLLLWGLANAGVAGLRWADCLAFGRRQEDLAAVARHRWTLLLGAAGQGLLWGVLGWWLFPAAPVDQFFLTLVLAGMAGGGVIFLSPFFPAYVVFLVPTMLPACFHLMAGALAMQKTVGLPGHRLFPWPCSSLRPRPAAGWGTPWPPRSENEDLVDRLKAANLLEAKAQLERQVEERTRSCPRPSPSCRPGLQEKEQERLRAAQSDENHLSLLQAINEGFGHVDERETFLFANPAAEKIFGVAPGTLAGRSLLGFLDPAGTAQVRWETETRRTGQGNRYLLPDHPGRTGSSACSR